MSNPRTEVEVSLRYLHPNGNVMEALSYVTSRLESLDIKGHGMEIERVSTWQDETQGGVDG